MGTTRYDDFTRPMDPGLAVEKINAAFGGIDPHDHAGAGRGGTIPGSAIGIFPGMMFPYAGASAPSGYLLCNGQAVSRTTYSALFAIIGVTYGAGDGSTTFNVPDMRGRVAIGLDNMGGTSANRVTDSQADVLGGSGGEEEHVLSINEMPNHTHYVNLYPAGGIADYIQGGKISNSLGMQTGATGGDQPHNNMQPWTACNYIIKY